MMKQKKLKFTILFFPALFALAIFPAVVFAATPEQQYQACISYSESQYGMSASEAQTACASQNPNNGNGGTQKLNQVCDQVTFVCQTGLTCGVGGLCVDPNQTTTPPPSQATPPSGGSGGGGGGAGGVSAGNGGDLCGAGFTKENGICLPNASVTGGLADSKSLSELIANVLKILLGLAGVIAVVFVVIGGFQYLTSSGNEELAEKGKKTLINAIIGIVVVVLAYALVNILVNLITTTPS